MDEQRMKIVSWGPVDNPPHPAWTVQSVTPVESNVDELVTWLRAQLDEDERVARAASSYKAEWICDPEDDTISGPNVYGMHSEGFVDAVHGAHIALHDPARVLREVESKRQIIDAYERAEAGAEFPTHEGGIAEGLERAVRLLAPPYADRPGYREDWRP